MKYANQPAHSTASKLSQTVDHKMKLYSAAAMAAEVSMLALAQPAEGAIAVTRE